MLLQQRPVQQVLHAQAAARHLVFVGGADTARGGADPHPSGRVLRRQFDQPVIGKNDVSAVADKQIAVNLDARSAQGIYFLQEGKGIEHHSVADDAAAAFAQHAAGNQLQDELFAVDGDRVSGIMAAGITRHHVEALREHVNDLALALVAPLGADDDCRLAFLRHTAPAASGRMDSHQAA